MQTTLEDLQPSAIKIQKYSDNTTDTTITYFEQEFHLTTDASNLACGAVLSQ
jgi:hypothetical protein